MKESYKRPRVFVDYDAIKEELEINNLTELSKIMNAKSSYLLLEKMISYADVPTSRKIRYLTKDKIKANAFTKENIGARNKGNINFYATFDEMNKWELANKGTFFCQTKQASIYMPSIFYEFIGIANPTTRQKKNDNWTDFYNSCGQDFKLNSSSINCFICNSSVEKYFDKDLTQKAYDKLNRGKVSETLNLVDGDFTKTDVHITPHGLGKSNDGVFSSLRLNVFAKDKLIILVEKKTNGKMNVYFAFYRNPKFFILNEIYNKDYILSRYSEELLNKEEQETRKGQAKWRDELAEFALGLSTEDEGFVECPFTGVKVQYPAESAFLRASHIKAYAKCKDGKGDIKIEEAYDLDNGFLVIADVDALFVKYLISVDPTTHKIVKSSALSKDVINHLNLKQEVAEKFIGPNKDKYLQLHYQEFQKRNSLSA